MTKAIAHTYTVAKDYRAQIAYVVLAACAGMTLIYAFNLYKVITDAIALRQIQAQEVALQSSLAELNTKYLDLSSRITPDSLHQYGFEPAQVTEYISRSASLGSVALRGHEL